MEKLIFVLWRDPAVHRDPFNASLLGPLPPALLAAGAQRLQINIPDALVDSGSHLNQGTRPLPDALVNLWLPSAHRASCCNALITRSASRIACYSVVESTVLPYSNAPGGDGRMPGFSQIALFSRRHAMTRAQFLETWLNDHTPIALATQETFYYTQNIISRSLNADAPPWDGIVDEWYPAEALTDPLVYWKAAGSEPTRQANYDREVASVERFVDFSGLALLITSAYRFGSWHDLS